MSLKNVFGMVSFISIAGGLATEARALTIVPKHTNHGAQVLLYVQQAPDLAQEDRKPLDELSVIKKENAEQKNLIFLLETKIKILEDKIQLLESKLTEPTKPVESNDDARKNQ